jgi:hypothetical protein
MYALGGTNAFHAAASLGSDFSHVGLGSPNVELLGLALSHQVAGAVDPSTSFTVDTWHGAAPADGQTADDVVVSLRDANGNAVSGKTDDPDDGDSRLAVRLSRVSPSSTASNDQEIA